MFDMRLRRDEYKLMYDFYARSTQQKGAFEVNPEESNEEGFANEEAESFIVPNNEFSSGCITSTVRSKPKKQEQIKLKISFIERNPSSREHLRKSIVGKQQRSSVGRSLDFTKGDAKNIMFSQLISKCVVKLQRTVIGENIGTSAFVLRDSNELKSCIFSLGAPLVYQQAKETNTYGFIKSLIEFSPAFIETNLNRLLKVKLKDSCIIPKRNGKKYNDRLQFDSNFQGANLQYVTKVGEKEYCLYLKNDTNTHGHQSWFDFKVQNQERGSVRVTFNICNLKRDLRLFQEGERIYLRKWNGVKPAEEWRLGGANFNINLNTESRFTTARVYNLSFEVDLDYLQTYQIALLPTYTYSDLMQDVEELATNECVSVQTLTFSLIGLAIPVLTFTRASTVTDKQVILINCRIHPGETVASFMAKGLMRQLVSEDPLSRQYLQKSIVKVVPMLNPDGVIFGNFRTNYLGQDLNRAFDHDNEAIHPEILALKNLGRDLKAKHESRFSLFIDLHGHSMQRNIFAYGPDYELGENYNQIRLLPKILNYKSEYFKYSSCSFKLEDYKRNTARGYFINALLMHAYTIQASYACYVNQKGKHQILSMADYLKFGAQLAESFLLLNKFSKFNSSSRLDIKKALLSDAEREEVELIRRFKKQLKKQQFVVLVKPCMKAKDGSDSDGQNQAEDLSKHEKEEIYRKVAENSLLNPPLPRVLKPTVLYPTITPKLFKVREEIEVTHLKILYTNKKIQHRNPNRYYIHSLRGIDSLKPIVRNILPQ